jgi:hypothetical protein
MDAVGDDLAGGDDFLVAPVEDEEGRGDEDLVGSPRRISVAGELPFPSSVLFSRSCFSSRVALEGIALVRLCFLSACLTSHRFCFNLFIFDSNSAKGIETFLPSFSSSAPLALGGLDLNFIDLILFPLSSVAQVIMIEFTTGVNIKSHLLKSSP